MKVISTNIGEPKVISWRGTDVKTGIYKYPVDKGIFLGLEDVKDDHVVDRKVHGGVDKACYLYSLDHYPYWKEKYPDLEWNYGMFGENITIQGLDESTIKIGAIYTLGKAVVQVSQPRQPCFKLGIRFGTQSILKEFIGSLFPGVYLRIITPGEVKPGDLMVLKKAHNDGITIQEMYKLFYHEVESESLITKAINDPFIKVSHKTRVLNRFGSSFSK
ncbi:MOSC domain-containing protein [Aquimarina sp. 2201CG5-10]|uniref:MOSC domain-containing protein n=1 Tax=Aquimarina callyspongiae TaxID=3098150 RepID=UPI002AB3D7D9|nr:MOSC domain-containing protein [Aquimarina sp. 2201CG5-10]MDY8136258.1 MOSC domain-containing protein [Aquimarina sp. 2201CG5-10]